MTPPTRRFLALGLALGICVALGGCDKLGIGKKRQGSASGEKADEETAKGPLQKAPAPEWGADGKLKLGKAEGTFLVTEKLELHLSLGPAPKGTKISTGTQQDVSERDGDHLMLGVDVSAALGKLSPDEAFDYKTQWKSGVKFTIALAGHESAEIEAPGISPSYGLKQALEGVKNRGVSFGKEPGTPAAQHTVVYLAGLSPKVIGPAKTLADVDWVAVQEDQPGRAGKTCDGYKDSKGGGTRSLPIEQVDRDVVVYERTTAKEIVRKKFTASSDCPMFAMGDTAKTYPDDSAIETWLRGERAKK